MKKEEYVSSWVSVIVGNTKQIGTSTTCSIPSTTTKTKPIIDIKKAHTNLRHLANSEDETTLRERSTQSL